MNRSLLVASSALFALVAAGCALDAKGLGTNVARADTGEGVDEDAALGEDAAPAEDATPVEDTEVVLDVEPEAPPPPLLPGCTPSTYGGHEYLFCERDGNWDQARVSCQFAGMQLVKVDDAAEHDFILKTLEPLSRSEFHIGLWDLASEGDFVWLDGSKPTFTSWAWLEPNDFLWREDCVRLDKRSGKWNDIECNAGQEGFVCETP